MWYLTNPGTGAQTVTVTLSGAQMGKAIAVSYSNVNQSTSIGAFNFTNTALATSLNGSLTTNTDGSLILSAFMSDATAAPSSLGSNQVLRQDDTDTFYGEADDKLAGTAGAKTMSYTYPGAQNMGSLLVEIQAQP
jgi:hypothetical protein